MQTRYQRRFELQLSAATARNNYEYLDILDRGFAAAQLLRPPPGIVCDIGCASFWYAAALHAFFRPRELIGVEVEGHRLFADGHTRVDYAAGYVASLPETRFLVADYRAVELPADIITAWFPFLTATAILAWRLPLSLLTPAGIFRRVYHNLRRGGLFVMVNHGAAEAGLAASLCTSVGLQLLARNAAQGCLSGQRSAPAVLTIWRRGGAREASSPR